jgi:NDP-4-keto-2,6-dideoxyhexose 3-C-methyltransferase
MRDHLANIARSALGIVDKQMSAVLDIGCNDGTLLSFYPPEIRKYGVDPSDIASDIDDPAITVVSTIFPSEQAQAAIPAGGIDIVTSIAMFYDLEDPVGFARAVRNIMSPDGIWIFEMSYLPLMLLRNSFDTICHEHLEYYSLATLEAIATRSGLRIFRAETNDINGGSIRCYACHASSTCYGTTADRRAIHEFRIREFEMELDTDRPYLEFQNRIERLRDELNTLLFDIRARGERVHVYGASTKGNELLQWYGINRVIVDCAADRNVQKVGSRTLGTDIPIVSEEESRAARPDYYLVLPWHFRREFLERERAMIMAGTKMIFPLPEVEIISAETYDEAVARAEQAG